MAPRVSSGRRRHLVTVQNPDAPVADGDGGFTQVWRDASPSTLYVSLEPATAQDLERLQVHTVAAGRPMLVTGPYHAGITTKTRLLFGSRVLAVVGVSSPDEARDQMDLYCVEQIT